MADHQNNNRGRFQKGVSGNLKGRPKGARNRRTALESELGATIPVTENGKRKKISKWEAFLKQLVNKAIAGDLRAAQILLAFVTRYEGRGLTEVKPAAGQGADANNPPAPLTAEEAARIYMDALKNAKPPE